MCQRWSAAGSHEASQGGSPSHSQPSLPPPQLHVLLPYRRASPGAQVDGPERGSPDHDRGGHGMLGNVAHVWSASGQHVCGRAQHGWSRSQSDPAGHGERERVREEPRGESARGVSGGECEGAPTRRCALHASTLAQLSPLAHALFCRRGTSRCMHARREVQRSCPTRTRKSSPRWLGNRSSECARSRRGGPIIHS